MIKIPNNKKIQVSTSSDVVGNIYRTKNITFEEKGKIKLAERTMCIADSSVYTDLRNFDGNQIFGIKEYGDDIWIGADKNLYYSDLATQYPEFTKDASSGTPTLASNYCDFAIWKGDLYLANNADILKFNGSTWTTFDTDAATFLEPFINRDRLAGVVNNNVNLYDSSGAVSQTLVVNDEYELTGLLWNNNRMYIGTYSNNGSDAVLLEWSGDTSEAENPYVIDGQGIMALGKYKKGCVFLTNRGELAYYYAGGVETLAYFPIYHKNLHWLLNTGTHSNNRTGHRGIKVVKDKIYIAISPNLQTALANSDVVAYSDMPGGVWCYDPEIGLHHIYSVGQSTCLRTDDIATTSVNTSTGVITVAGVTVPATGTPVFYKKSDIGSEGTSGTVAKVGVRYFTIKVTDTTLKLAETYADAINGTAITLLGTGTNTQYLTFHPNYDFGGLFNPCFNLELAESGDIYFMGNHLGKNMFISHAFQRSTNATRNTIGLSVVQGEIENRGYFLTPWVEADQLQDTFHSISIKWKKLINPDDKIIVKYRYKDTTLPEYVTYGESVNSTENITITSANTFTTTRDLSDVSVGDEMEIVSGAGAGYLAHITNLVNNSGTWTITIDESIQNFTANDVCKAVFQNWKKLTPITSTSQENDECFKLFRTDKKSKKVQFKIELRGIETTIEEVIINPKQHKGVL